MQTYSVYCETGMSVAEAMSETEALEWAQGFANGNGEPAFVCADSDPTDCLYEILPEVTP